MFLSQKAGTPRRRTQRAPAKRANRHAAIPLAAQRHFFGARLAPPSRTAGKRWKAPCRPACPTNIQYPVNTPVPAESQTRGPPHATRFAHITGQPPFLFRGTPPCTRNRLPPKSAFRPLFAPSAPQPPRSGRRLPFPRAVDRRSDAAVCQSGAFTKTSTVRLRGKKANDLFRPDTFTGEFRIRYAAQTGAEALQACIAWKRAARRAASVDFTTVIFSSRRTAVSPPAC